MSGLICGGFFLVIVVVTWFVKQSSTGDLVPAELHKRFVLLAIILALPFISCGTLLWWRAWSFEKDSRMYEGTYGWGSLAYVLGMPLTVIVFALMEDVGLSSRNYWWAIPLIDFLFVLQWVIWGQLLALGIRLFRTIRDAE